MLYLSCLSINAPEECRHGTHTNGTAYIRGTYSRALYSSLSIYVSIYLSIYLSIWLFANLSAVSLPPARAPRGPSGKLAQPAMPPTPYVTRNALASLKQGCAGTDNLRITDDMLLWTPAEARRYFESVGQEKPDPDVVARRSPDDTAPPPVRTGAARGEQELLYGLFCPCCDTIICEAMEHRARKKARAAATSNGAVGLEMQR